MLTRREANQRAEVYNGRIVWLRDWQEYQVTLNEWTRKEREDKAYHTDDLDDAIHTLAAMRKAQP